MNLRRPLGTFDGAHPVGLDDLVARPPRDDGRILLSIIIPCRDRHALVAQRVRAIEMLMNELGCSDVVELIVVDDGSEPPLALAAEGLRFDLQRLPTASGAQEARRIGLARARGEYVHFHDSDDEAGVHWYEAVLATCRGDDAPDVMFTGRREVAVAGAGRPKVPRFARFASSHPSFIHFRLRFENCLGPITGVVIRRRLLDDVPVVNLASSQDWQLYLHVFEHAESCAYVPDVHFTYNRHDGVRISSSHRRKYLGMSRLHREVWGDSSLGRLMRLHFLDIAARATSNAGSQRLLGILDRTKSFRVAVRFTVKSVFRLVGAGLRLKVMMRGIGGRPGESEVELVVEPPSSASPAGLPPPGGRSRRGE